MSWRSNTCMNGVRSFRVISNRFSRGRGLRDAVQSRHCRQEKYAQETDRYQKLRGAKRDRVERQRRNHQHVTLEPHPGQPQSRHRAENHRRFFGPYAHQRREWNQPDQNQARHRKRRPRHVMRPLNDKESFDRQVAVPDNDVLREQQIYPEHRESEDHLAKVVHDGWIREQVVLAQTTAQHDRGEGHRGQSTPEAPGEKIPAEKCAAPHRRERHDQIECDKRIDRREQDRNQRSEHSYRMWRQLDFAGRNRPRPRVITTRDANEREARYSHHAEPDSITGKKERSVQPRSLLRYRMRYPWENQAAAEVQSKEQKKSYPQKWRERLAEPIRRRTAPLCLRQIERRRRDHRALRNAKEEQQIDEIGFPCDRGSASQQRRHERDRAEDDHSARHLLHRR